jgi:hypothetical protein
MSCLKILCQNNAGGVRSTHEPGKWITTNQGT